MCEYVIARRNIEEEIYNEFPYYVDPKYCVGSTDVSDQYEKMVSERMKEHPLYSKNNSNCDKCHGNGTW